MPALLIAVVACAPETPSGPWEVGLANARTIVSLESELLGRANAMTVDDEGVLWIADGPSQRMLVVPPEGAPWTFGTAGEGPGEFDEPSGVVVRDGIVQVLDRGNARLQEYDAAGRSLHDRTVTVGLFGYSALGPNGRIVAGTIGSDSALAIIAEGDADPLRLGPVVYDGPPFFDMVAMKATIAKGEVPDAFRNMALPIAGETAAWLVIHSEREVRKYRSDGTLAWTTTLDGPEVDAAFDAFFRANAENDGPGIAGLTIATDGQEVDGDLWLLMNGQDGAPATIRVLDGETGAEIGRLTADVPVRATRLALDRANDRLYLALQDIATIVSFSGVEG